jgi:hypothetical protein
MNLFTHDADWLIKQGLRIKKVTVIEKHKRVIIVIEKEQLIELKHYEKTSNVK